MYNVLVDSVWPVVVNDLIIRFKGYMSVIVSVSQGYVNVTWFSEGLCILGRKIAPLQSFLDHEIHDGSILLFKPKAIIQILSMVQWGTAEEINSVRIFTKSMQIQL